MEEENTTPVSIPTSLFRQVEEKIKGTSFSSVSSYVTYLLRETIAETKEQTKQAFSKEEEEKVQERLRALGYI